MQTAKGLSLRLKGQMYGSCVQRMVVYGSEMWAANVEDMGRLERMEKAMMHWICEVTF